MADVILNSGRSFSAGLQSNTETQIGTYYGNVGTGAGTADETDTELFTETGTARIGITPTRVTTVFTNDTSQYVFTYTATGNITVTNAGYATAATGGIWIQKSDMEGVPLKATDSIEFTFQHQNA
jgi:hypothetical protein